MAHAELLAALAIFFNQSRFGPLWVSTDQGGHTAACTMTAARGSDQLIPR